MISIQHLVFVAMGGALGAVARYLIVAWVTDVAGNRFPWGTLTVNAVGSFLLGIAFIIVVEKLHGQGELRALIMVGFLGAMTTFSTFSLEAWSLFDASRVIEAVTYVVVSVILCVLSVLAGISLARFFL